MKDQTRILFWIKHYAYFTLDYFICSSVWRAVTMCRSNRLFSVADWQYMYIHILHIEVSYPSNALSQCPASSDPY